MLIRPSIAESANKDNVVIGEPRKGKEGDKVLGREVVLDKQPDGKFIKPKNSEVGKWEKSEAKRKRIRPTFDMLLSKYASQAAVSISNRPSHSKRS